MKHAILAVGLLAGSVSLMAASPAETVAAAAKKLAAADNYAWKTTSESSGFNRGPTEGKVNKDGLTHLKLSMRENTTEVVMKGESVAIQTQEGWRTADETAEQGEGRGAGRFMAMMVRNMKAPAAEAETLLKNIEGLSLADGVYSGKLTEAGVKEMLSFRGRGGQGPEIGDPSGSAKFWLKDGLLAKYQYTVKGTMSFGGNEREIDRTTTVEISGVNATKVEPPAEAMAKLK